MQVISSTSLAQGTVPKYLEQDIFNILTRFLKYNITQSLLLSFEQDLQSKTLYQFLLEAP